jgi:polyhydroxyalkanoate synthesis repressor PhaR
MSEPRVIKKYPNRRLYDTVESRYITIADIKRLVLEKAAFVVIDKKSGDDITRHILLQVIGDAQDSGQNTLMSEPLLAELIRAGGTSNAQVLGPYLEYCMRLFLENQQLIRDRVRSVAVDPSEPAAAAKLQARAFQEELIRMLAAATA